MNKNNKLNLNFDYNNLIRNTKINNNTIDIANLIMNNTFYESPQLDKIEFGEKIDWNYHHSKSANSYQLYLHSLNLISYLTDAYLVSKEVKYLKKAYSILEDWILYNKSQCREKKDYVWSDHATSYRTINIIYLYLVANNMIKIDHDKIYCLLLEHLDFLNNFPDYRNDNHGIMIDKTLLISSFIFNDSLLKSVYFNKSYYRLRESFFRDFSRRGVHLENSVDYHCIVKRLFREINDFLVKMDLSLGEDITKALYGDFDYLEYIQKPDHRLPLIGDTSGVQVNKLLKCYDNFLDIDAGIAIFQKENIEQPDKSLWLSFICGYSNFNHKHNDDLSILLSNNGYDIFVDSGKYNYNYGDPIRKYCKSVEAHNTLQIGNTANSYTLYQNANYAHKPRITDYFQASQYSIVKGLNPCYTNSSLVKRTVVLIKSSVLVIYDEIECANIQNCIQSFNLAPGMNYKKLGNNRLMLTNNNYDVLFEQHIPIDNIKILEPDSTIPQAVISETFSNLTDIKQIKTHKSGNQVCFLTSINLEPEKVKIKNIEIDNKDNVLKVKLDNENFQIYI